MTIPPGLRRRQALRSVAGMLGWIAVNDSTAGPKLARPVSPPALVASGLKPTRHDFLTSDGIRLSYLSCGRPSKHLPMLFVPGWCMPAELFSSHLSHFAATRPVFALDPRGHGESDTPEHGYDADRRALDLFECLRRFKRPPIVVAWSLGGLEMLHGLHRFGSTGLSALALVDSSLGEGPAGTGEGIEAFRNQLRTDREATLASFARAIFRNEQSDGQIDSLVQAMLHVPLEPSLSMLDYRLPRETLRHAARDFQKPLLVAITPQYREQARLHLAARPQTRVELYEDAGHAVFADQPMRFNAMLESFSVQTEAAKPASQQARPVRSKR